MNEDDSRNLFRSLHAFTVMDMWARTPMCKHSYRVQEPMQKDMDNSDHSVPREDFRQEDHTQYNVCEVKKE